MTDQEAKHQLEALYLATLARIDMSFWAKSVDRDDNLEGAHTKEAIYRRMLRAKHNAKSYGYQS